MTEIISNTQNIVLAEPVYDTNPVCEISKIDGIVLEPIIGWKVNDCMKVEPITLEGRPPENTPWAIYCPERDSWSIPGSCSGHTLDGLIEVMEKFAEEINR